ncbi:MAG: hypothetical protein H7320_17155 [Ferruginibacter sp.]|nr:hypothetical protein [Ferruginibacter sp.]
MKLWLLSLVIICCAFVAKGQQAACYIPSSQTYSTAAIAGYVQVNFTTDREKLSAIYGWVTANIRYDKDSMYNINWGVDEQTKATATLRRRKGVCENFATVFTDIVAKCGLASFTVTGYTNIAGYIKKTGHSWSAVQLDKAWLLCDPTWDAGAGNNTAWFLIQPDQFIETHIPFDPLWQLLPRPVSQQEFNKEKYRAKKELPFWNIADSVDSFLQLDSLQQLEATSRRIKQTGMDDEMTRVWRQYVDMKIAIVYGDKDMNFYNGAVADINKAAAIFNEFVQYRNNRFIPAKPDAETATILNPIDRLLAAARKKINHIGESVENVQYDTGSIKERLNHLFARVAEQQFFLKQYLESSVADRGKLFYQ